VPLFNDDISKRRWQSVSTIVQCISAVGTRDSNKGHGALHWCERPVAFVPFMSIVMRLNEMGTNSTSKRSTVGK
jgi:hypothetical protein